MEESLPPPGARGPSLPPRLQIWVLPCAHALPHPKPQLWPASTLRPDFCQNCNVGPTPAPNSQYPSNPNLFLIPSPCPSDTPYPASKCPPTLSAPSSPQIHFSPSRCPPSAHQSPLLDQAVLGALAGRGPSTVGPIPHPQTGIEGQRAGAGVRTGPQETMAGSLPAHLPCSQGSWGPCARTHMRAPLRGHSDSGPAPSCLSSQQMGGSSGANCAYQVRSPLLYHKPWDTYTSGREGTKPRP